MTPTQWYRAPILGAPPTIIFLHIGRTAGTTLNSVLDRQYRHGAIYHVDSHRLEQSLAELRALPDERRRALRVIRGHVSFGVHEWIPGPSTYITLLRDPVERVISHYQYVLERPHRLSRRVIEEKMTLEDYVRSGISTELNDWQTRVIAGDEHTPFGATGRPLLERATANIEERFSVVGLSERFEETVALLKRAFGWRRAYYAPLNATRDRPVKRAVPGAALEAIKELNALDIELYERAQAQFDEALAADREFARELRALRRHNSVYAPLAPLDRQYRRGVNLLRRVVTR